ncbi:MAG: hypothetical protein ACK5XM_07875 [Betaproteobacteria bacterium]
MAVTRQIIREQLRSLSALGVLDGAAASRYLDQPKPDHDAPESCLSLYAKWLVLVDLLFDRNPNCPDLKSMLDLSSNELLRDLFVPNSARSRKGSEFYDPTWSTHRQHHKALWSILDCFNQGQLAHGLPPLNMAQLVGHEAKLQAGVAVVGWQPIRRLKEWLAHRLQVPNPSRQAGVESALTSEEARVLDALDRAEPHRVITNVTAADPAQSDAYVSALVAAAQRSGDDQSRPYLPVVVSLVTGLTRSSVVQTLRAAVLLEARRDPAAVDAEVDLHLDLLDIRATLTAVKILIIFTGWQNAGGGLAGLNDFLRDTEWAELVRCLAQPHHPNLKTAVRSPSMLGRIVVISSLPVSELEPWTTHHPMVSGAEASAATATRPLDDAIRSAVATRYWWDPDGVARVQARSGPMTFAAEPSAPLLPYQPLLLKFVLASVNGMQRSTLQRCLKLWISFFGWTPQGRAPSSVPAADTVSRVKEAIEAVSHRADFDSLVGALLAAHPELLVERQGEIAPGLTSDSQSIGLDRRPAIDRQRGGRSTLAIEVRNPLFNAQAVMAWREAIADAADEQDAGLDLSSWQHVNFILSEESLRQATAQMRALTWDVRESPQWHRRLIQCVYHGLCAENLDARPVINAGFLSGSPYGPGIPGEARRRFQYLYVFVYRQCIEGGDWRLGRSFGRSALRLQLLQLFLSPSRAHHLLTGTLELGAAGLLPGDFAVEEGQEWKPRNPELRCDLIEALARAGLDAGSQEGRNATRWALSMLPGWRLGCPLDASVDVTLERHDIEGALPANPIAYRKVERAAFKLRLDWLLSSGQESELSKVHALCREHLAGAGVDPRILDGLRQEILAVLKLALSDLSGVTDGISAALVTAFERILGGRTMGDGMHVSDVLFRLAESTATLADTVAFRETTALPASRQAALPDAPPGLGAIERFAEACALYWLGDRVRAVAATHSEASTRWPVASARPMRYFIRVCLRLARLILDRPGAHDRKRARDLAHALLDLAQDRLGVLTRHHFRLHRERVSVLLLETARVRTCVRVEVEQRVHDFCKSLVRLAASMAQAQTDVTQKETSLELAKKAMRDRQPYKRGSALLESARNTVKAAEEALAKSHARVRLVRADVRREVRDASRVLHAQRLVLRTALDNLVHAEATTVALGFQRSHVRRLYLERMKCSTTQARIFLAWADLMGPAAGQGMGVTGLGPAIRTVFPAEIDGLVRQVCGQMRRDRLDDVLELGRTALCSLSATSKDDPFWEGICRRQEVSLETVSRRLSQMKAEALTRLKRYPT